MKQQANERPVVLGGRRRVVANGVANWMTLLVQVATGLILVRVVTDALGQEVYGAWGLIGGMLEFLTLSVLGLSHAVPKLKTHKKACVTSTLTNLVGINVNRDFFPHHRRGGFMPVHIGNRYEMT